ncbi:hypothetical protein XENOCAPTIV_030902 [Xenoophorus captivus]|uniref:Secreted protein n=1 Tax=Xenoophorus captivus TaxID=1517983 RepID=A0ABV0R647_9TELE
MGSPNSWICGLIVSLMLTYQLVSVSELQLLSLHLLITSLDRFRETKQVFPSKCKVKATDYFLYAPKGKIKRVFDLCYLSCVSGACRWAVKTLTSMLCRDAFGSNGTNQNLLVSEARLSLSIETSYS